MSISSFSAQLLRHPWSGPSTWNPMMIAFRCAQKPNTDIAFGNLPRTALWITFTWISGVDNLIEESDKVFDRTIHVSFHDDVQLLEVSDGNTSTDFVQRE